MAQGAHTKSWRGSIKIPGALFDAGSFYFEYYNIITKAFSLLFKKNKIKEETVVSDDEPAEEMELAVQPPASYSHQYTHFPAVYISILSSRSVAERL